MDVHVERKLMRVPTLLDLVLTHGISRTFRDGVHIYIVNRHRASSEFNRSRNNCVPMAFTAERSPAQGQ